MAKIKPGIIVNKKSKQNHASHLTGVWTCICGAININAADTCNNCYSPKIQSHE